MHTVWDHLYPELNTGGPLPANTAANAQLTRQLKELAFIPPQLNTTSPLSAALSRKTYILDDNPFKAKKVSFRFAGDKTVFTLTEEGKPDIVITCGMNHWIMEGNRKPEAHSLFSLRRIDFDSPVAASAGWKDDHTLVLTFRFVEAIHGDTLTCSFDGEKLRIQPMFSGARMDKKPDDRADITGQRG